MYSNNKLHNLISNLNNNYLEIYNLYNIKT